MPLLKAQSHRQASKDAVVLDLGDLGRQAAKLRAIAEAKAESILTRAQAEAARLTAGATEAGDQRGYQDGLERGRLEGQEQGKAEALQQHAQQLQQTQEAWANAITDYEQRFQACEREASAVALQLAVKLAEKVIHQHIAVDSKVVVDQVNAALSHVLEPARVKVHVHPDDRAVLADALPNLIDSLDQITHADVIEDADVARGGCVIHAGPATIDAQAQTQLDRLASLLLGNPQPAQDNDIQDTDTQDTPASPNAPDETLEPT